MKNFVLHFIALLLYNAGTKIGTTPEMAASWCPQAHGCAICAAALPAQKREKKLF